MREAAGDSYIVTPLESWMVMMSKEFCTSARKRASPSCKMSVLRRSRGERSKGPARTTTPPSPSRASDRCVFRYSSDTPPQGPDTCGGRYRVRHIHFRYAILRFVYTAFF